MREEYLDAISELEESLSPFHLESDGEWTNYEFNTSTIRVAIQALEKQVAKKPVWVVDVFECPSCGEDLGNTDNTEYYCWNCGQKLDWSVGE